MFDGASQVVEAARPHMRICFLPSDHHEYASSKPNARLIAAAPDLLTALRELTAMADKFETETAVAERPGSNLGILQAIDEARTVIAKAEGRS
jgi:hypothetical protein